MTHMRIEALLIDLDDTLIVEEKAAEAAFLTACGPRPEAFWARP